MEGTISIVVSSKDRFKLQWQGLSIEEVITVLLKAPLKMIEMEEVVIGTVAKEPKNGKVG